MEKRHLKPDCAKTKLTNISKTDEESQCNAKKDFGTLYNEQITSQIWTGRVIIRKLMYKVFYNFIQSISMILELYGCET